MSVSLYTVGYEGAEIGLFLATLCAAGIEHVIDVRDVPISRKRGFSKNSLSACLSEVGIEYTHLKPLGDPKPGRDAMRKGDHETFLRVYHAHLATVPAQHALDKAVTIAESATSVLLCYERAPRHCHRSIVAMQMSKRATFVVQHLGVNSSILPRQRQPQLHSAGLARANL